MTYKVAVVGPAGIITGLSALGAQPFPASTSEEAHKVIADIVRTTNETDEKYAVVMVIEDLLTGIPEKEYRILTKNVLPSVVALPGTNGSTGYMTERLREFTVRAIGSDIM